VEEVAEEATGVRPLLIGYRSTVLSEGLNLLFSKTLYNLLLKIISSSMYVICITGASGAVYGLRLIEELKKRTNEQVALIMSRWGLTVAINEVDIHYRRRIMKLVDNYYTEDELDAEIASGSTKIRAVVVAPCSMKTLSDIAHARASNLITRVVDVALKEGRKVIIVPRETPLDYTHIRNLLLAKKRGIIISTSILHKP